MTKTMKLCGAPILVLAILAGLPVRADMEQGMSYFQSGKYLEAAAEFQALVDQSPSYDYGFFMMGLSFLKMGKPADAEKNLLKAIELNGDRFEYHFNLANSYFQAKQYPKSIATLKTAEGLAEDTKTKFALYNLRGLSYAGLEKWADAVDDLEKARAIKKTPPILDRLSTAYYALGHYDKAVPVLREALATTSGQSSAQSKLANALLNLGAETQDDSKKGSYYNEALAAADAYRKLRPNSHVAHNLSGRAALGAKRFDYDHTITWHPHPPSSGTRSLRFQDVSNPTRTPPTPSPNRFPSSRAVPCNPLRASATAPLCMGCAPIASAANCASDITGTPTFR